MRNLERAVVYGKPRQRECAAVAEGLRALGAAVTWRNHGYLTEGDIFPDMDVAVTFGQRLHSATAARMYRELGIPVLTVDLPPLRVGEMGETHRALWLNHVNWMPGPCPPDRLERLGLRFRERREDARRVLVCGQTDDDAAHGMGPVEMREWARETLTAVDEFYPVTWRPHPRNVFKVAGFSAMTLAQSFAEVIREGWRAVVTYNSTVGLQALLEGIPVFCSPRSFYARLGNVSLVGLHNPKFPAIGELMSFFSRIAYVQWTFEELASGEALRFILPRAERRAA